MVIKVLLFSLFRDICGAESVEMKLEAPGVMVSDLLECAYAAYPALREWDEKMLIAVNCEFADRSDVVNEGDEIALMPPVQGG